MEDKTIREEMKRPKTGEASVQEGPSAYNRNDPELSLEKETIRQEQ